MNIAHRHVKAGGNGAGDHVLDAVGVQYLYHIPERLERRHGSIRPITGRLHPVQVQAFDFVRRELGVQVLQSLTCESTRKLGQLERLPEALLRSHVLQNPDIDPVVRPLFHTLESDLERYACTIQQSRAATFPRVRAAAATRVTHGFAADVDRVEEVGHATGRPAAAG
jgi:hypothetical protein